MTNTQLVDAMSPHANRFHKHGLLLFVFFACFATSELLAESPASDPIVTSIPPAKIEQWTLQLDDDSYDIRQRAQQQLEQAGKPAILAVATVANAGSLESSTRAINILLQWSESSEADLRFAALEKLANLPNRPRESTMATRLLANFREQEAIKAIKKLGGRISQDRGLHNLQIEIDNEWKGGDEGMRLLADVHHALKIRVRVAPITDLGLELLGNVSQVRLIEIQGTKISDPVLNSIKQKLPNATIDVRNGPMLGIHGNENDTNQDSVGVYDVVVNGAAHKAGIRPGDRIAKLEGEKLTDFKSLTTRIAKHKPGDTVEMTLLRKNKPLTVTVTFDQWGANDNTKLLNRQKLKVQQLPLHGQPIQIKFPRR